MTNMSDEEKVDVGNQLMCLVSQKTQMPLCAITAKFTTADGHEKRSVLSLGLKDHLGNVWHQNGKGSLKDACDHDLSTISLKRLRQKYNQEGVFDVVYTSIDELQTIKLIDATKLNHSQNTVHHVSDVYIQQHTPPTYEGFAHMHEHLRTYMQANCVYYAIALADALHKPLCTISVGHAVHYAIRHDDGEVEDIWGKRGLSAIAAEFTNNPQTPVVSPVDAGSIALLRSVKFGEIHKAKSIVKSNPRHVFNQPLNQTNATKNNVQRS